MYIEKKKTKGGGGGRNLVGETSRLHLSGDVVALFVM